MTSTRKASFTLSVDASVATRSSHSTYVSIADSFSKDSCDASSTAEVIGRLNYLRVPRPAPCLTIPKLQRHFVALAAPRRSHPKNVTETPVAESIWTPFGLPQSSCGISLNVWPDSEGVTPTERELLSMASTDRTTESFFIEVVDAASRPNQPSSILMSVTSNKETPCKLGHLDSNAYGAGEGANAGSLSGSCGGSGLHAIRRLRLASAPTAVTQPHAPALVPRPTHSLTPEPCTRRPSHHLVTCADAASLETAAHSNVPNAVSVAETVPVAGLPLGRRRRVTHTGVPSFAAQTPVFTAMLTRSRARRLPRGPAFFPAWSARNNTAPQPPEEEELLEGTFNRACDDSSGLHHRLLVQQPSR